MLQVIPLEIRAVFFIFPVEFVHDIHKLILLLL